MLKKTIPIATAIAIALSSASAFSAGEPKSPTFWWPDQLNLMPLRQNAEKSNPLGENFNYAKAFNSLDLEAVKKDIRQVINTPQDWWPADYGNYGPFFIRMAWHSAGSIASLTVVVVQPVVSNVSSHSIAGLIM